MGCARQVLAITAIAASLAFAKVAPAAETGDFVAFATDHCQGILQGGKADLGFALGKAEAKFSEAERRAFNQRFAAKLAQDFGMDTGGACVLDEASVGTADVSSHKPASSRRPVNREKEQAVVSGHIDGVNQVPVAVSYRLERTGEHAWIIRNISLNGQPLADRYREEYESLAVQGGVDAVLGQL